jgi:tRNA(Arg) A34 adenosine deaminase TadA
MGNYIGNSYALHRYILKEEEDLLTTQNMDSLIKKRMKLACRLASKSVENGTGPFGCVITDGDYNIIAKTHNHVTDWNDPTAHAEMVAIRLASKKLQKYDLSDYILFTSCEPCPMCLSAIYWARITEVYYGNTQGEADEYDFDDALIYDEIIKEKSDRVCKMHQICTDNKEEAFRKWNTKANKTTY